MPLNTVVNRAGQESVGAELFGAIELQPDVRNRRVRKYGNSRRAAQKSRRNDPVETIDEPVRKQVSGHGRTSFAQQARYSALAQRVQRSGQV